MKNYRDENEKEKESVAFSPGRQTQVEKYEFLYFTPPLLNLMVSLHQANLLHTKQYWYVAAVSKQNTYIHLYIQT